jgi:hypothetical protein
VRTIIGILGLTAWTLRLLCATESDLPPLPELEEPPSNWIRSFDVRAWSGYKDNVLLGNQNEVGSALVGGGADIMFYRLPVSHWEYTFFASAEYIRYVTTSQVDGEATVLAHAQAKRALGQNWKTGLSAEYLYFNQVFDSSVFEEVLVPVQIQGNSLTLRPSVARHWGDSGRLELELPGTRQLFDEFIDNFWEVGPKLIGVKEFGRAELGLSYQFLERFHDTREARTAEGVTEPGRLLRFDQHELAFTWRQFWDADRHWRTNLKLGLQRNTDNGGGYYDYWRPQFTSQLRYQAKTWEVRAEARVSYYDYDHQRVDDADSERRSKTYLRLGLRGEKSLTKKLKLFGQFEHEQALSNWELDQYRANTAWIGLGWEF